MIAALDGALPAGDAIMTSMAGHGERGMRQTCTILMAAAAGRRGIDVKLLDAQVLPSRNTPCIVWNTLYLQRWVALEGVDLPAARRYIYEYMHTLVPAGGGWRDPHQIR